MKFTYVTVVAQKHLVGVYSLVIILVDNYKFRMRKCAKYQQYYNACAKLRLLRCFVSSSMSAESDDFTVPNPLQVTIPAGPIPSSPPVCVLIMATDDNQTEGDHGFTVSINQSSLSGVTVGSPGSAVVTITDNDGMLLTHRHIITINNVKHSLNIDPAIIMHVIISTLCYLQQKSRIQMYISNTMIL